MALKLLRIEPDKLLDALWACDMNVINMKTASTLLGLPFKAFFEKFQLNTY
jgi:hypothetical protein